MQLTGCETGEPLSIMNIGVIGCGQCGPNRVRVFSQIRDLRRVPCAGTAPGQNGLDLRNRYANHDSAESVLGRLPGKVPRTLPAKAT